MGGGCTWEVGVHGRWVYIVCGCTSLVGVHGRRVFLGELDVHGRGGHEMLLYM